MKEDFLNRQSHGKLVVLLILVAYFFLMCGNGRLSLTHPDEVFYIQTAKEMLAHHGWLTPILFDHPQFEKPILSFILFASGIKFFGLSPSVARFWPAFFGIVGVLATYWISWMLFRQKRLSFLAGLILSTSFIYIALSRGVLTDMIFSVFVVLSIGCFIGAYQNKKWSSRGIIGGFALAGLAVLTKGLLGYSFPMTVMLIFLFYKNDRSFWTCKATLWGIVIFLIIALPWHVFMYQRYGQPFIDEYWWNVHVRRIFVAEHQRSNTWYFYLLVMFAGVMPWSLFLIPTFRLCMKQIKNKLEHAEGIAFLICWIAGVYFYVQIAQSKLASYILPIFPAIAILLAYYLHQAFERKEDSRTAVTFKRIGYGMSVLLGITMLAAVFVSRKYAYLLVDKKPLYVFILLALLVTCGIFYLIYRRYYVKMTLSFSCITLTLLIVLFLGVPNAESWVSCKRISEKLETFDHSQSTILTSKFYVRGVRYFTDRPVAVIDINGQGFFSPHPIPFFNKKQSVLEFLESQPVTYSVVKKGNVEDLKQIVHGKPFRLTELYQEGGKYILRIDKL